VTRVVQQWPWPYIPIIRPTYPQAIFMHQLANQQAIPSTDSYPAVSYIRKWSIFIHWIRVLIVRWQSDLVNTKESLLPVSDTPYHTNKRKLQKGEWIKVNYNHWTVIIIIQVSPSNYWVHVRNQWRHMNCCRDGLLAETVSSIVQQEHIDLSATATVVLARDTR